MTIVYTDTVESVDEFHVCFITPRTLTSRDWYDLGYDGYSHEDYWVTSYPYESGKTIFVGVNFDEDLFVSAIYVADTAEELNDCDAVDEYTMD